MPVSFRCCCGLAVVAALGVTTGAAIAEPLHVGQVDTFEFSAPEGWANGNPATDPTVQAGGPGGASDHYLRISGDGGGTGGKITAYNREQWIGNYAGAGVTAIAMDLRNFASTTLQVRFAFKEAGGFGSPGYCVTNPFVIANDGLWHRAVFNLVASEFTGLSDPQPFENVLRGMPLGEVRILHSTMPSLTGSNVSGALGVDNITAVPGPETALIVLGGLGLVRRRR